MLEQTKRWTCEFCGYLKIVSLQEDCDSNHNRTEWCHLPSGWGQVNLGRGREDCCPDCLSMIQTCGDRLKT